MQANYGPLLRVAGVALLAGLSVAVAHYACRFVASLTREYDADQPDLQAQLAGAGAEEPPMVPPRDCLHWALWTIGTIYTGYLLLLVFGGIVWPIWPGPLGRLLEAALINPLMIVSTYGKMLLMLLTAYIAAYNPGLRRPAGLLLAVGHAVSVVCLLAFRYYEPSWDHTGSDHPYPELFLPAAALDAVFAVIGAVAFFTSEESPATKQGSPFELESIPALGIRAVLTVLGGASFLFAVGTVVIRYVKWKWFLDQELWWNNDLQLANAVTRYAVLGTIAWTIARRPKLGEHFLGLATATYITTVFAASVALLLDASWDGFGGVVIRRVGGAATVPVDVSSNLVRTVIVDSVLIGAIQVLERLYYRSEYGITTLSPVVARAVWALHEALFPTEESVAEKQASAKQASDEQTLARQAAARNQTAIVVQRVQAYAGGVRGRLQIAITLPFALLQIFSTLIFGHRPGFSILSVKERRFFLRKYLLRPPLERRASWSPELAEAAFKLTEAAHSLIVLAKFCQRNAERFGGLDHVEVARIRSLRDVGKAELGRGRPDRDPWCRAVVSRHAKVGYFHASAPE
jgi:hypothetical protein